MSDEERLKIIRETPHYFTCDVMRKDFLYLFRQAEQVPTLESYMRTLAKYGDDTRNKLLEAKKENNVLREALVIAYSHCEDNLMDETIDVIRMALDGEEVKEIWSGELAKGYSLLKEQEQ